MVEALPQDGGDGNGQPAILDRGRVAVLDNQVDQNTGTIKLKAIFPNPALRLWPGAFVNIRLALRVDRGVVTVPTAAVQRGPQGAFVFTLANDVASRHPVTVSRQDEQVAVISAGLAPGATGCDRRRLPPDRRLPRTAADTGHRCRCRGCRVG